MALPSTMIWEISTLGNIDNGGGFDSAFIGTGTDYSQQASPQVTFNGSTIKATTASASNTITLTGYTVSSTDVGNILNITGGTNFVVGRYAIASVSVGSNTWTLAGAATATTGAGAAMTGRMGGSVNNPSTIAPIAVTSNTIFIKADGVYTITSSITNIIANQSPSPSSPPNRFIGYGTIRGDNVRCSFVASGVTGSILNFNCNGWHISNVDLDGGLSSAIGILINNYGIIYNCKVYRCGSNGFSGNNTILVQCEGYSCGNPCVDGFGYILNCYIHDNVGTAIRASVPGCVINNIVANNSGSSSDGIRIEQIVTAIGNTVYNSGRNGINISTSNSLSLIVQDNILINNGAYGLQLGTVGGTASRMTTDGNVYYNNTSGARNFGDDTIINPQNAVGAYTNVNDVFLTRSPFIDEINNDFRLNSNVGGGLSCIGKGVPRGFPGNSSIGYLDMGAVQMPKNIRMIGFNGGYSN